VGAFLEIDNGGFEFAKQEIGSFVEICDTFALNIVKFGNIMISSLWHHGGTYIWEIYV
jgi:hypothetical protein